MSGAANVPPPSGNLDLCYEGDPDLLPAAEATRRIQAHVPVIDDTQTVPLTEALARVLAHDVTSPLDVPGHTNSAVDGFALHGQTLPSTGECTVQVIGRSFAGSPYPHSVAAGQCVRIMTGAVMPAGADTIVIQEHARTDGDTVIVPPGSYRVTLRVRCSNEICRPCRSNVLPLLMLLLLRRTDTRPSSASHRYWTLLGMSLQTR